MTPELGIIEGFYGKPWSWEARAATAALLVPRGYLFYLYAPKGDAYLRRRWQEPHPPEVAAQLAAFSTHCGSLGVRFGIGLSPYELYADFDEAGRAALAQKLAWLDELRIQDLAILFDDMRGDTPHLAERQLEIVQFASERTRADRIFVCPTYYSDDPVLDRVYGARPPRYLEQLGTGLAAGVQIFWTGEEVISRELTAGHLRPLAETLGRRPFLWDNYPVNDGARMCRYLHLRGFTGRRPDIAEHIAGHGVNPALQPVLSCIPALTLAESYELGENYQYAAAFRRAAASILGSELGQLLWEDILTLQDVGLERLDEQQVARLRERYGRFEHEGAREVLAWLDGEYAITNVIVQSQ